MGPLTLAALRFTVAALVFLALMRRLPIVERRLGRDRWLLLGMALSGVVVCMPLLYWALHYTTASNAALINGAAPLMTAIWAVCLVRESITARQAVGAVLALAGVTILVSGGSIAYWRELKINFGDLLMIAAVTLWSLYSVLGRWVMKRSGRSAVSVTALSTYLGLPFLWIAAAWEMSFSPTEFTPKIIMVAVYIGLVPTVIALVAWNAGVRRLGASGAMIFYNTLPLYGASLGALVLGETLGLVHVVGGLLIISGGLWSAKLRQAHDPKHPVIPKHRQIGK